MNNKREELAVYWSLSGDELLRILESDAEKGLATAEATNRLARVGLNRIEARKKTTPLGMFLNQFKSPIMLILIFATAVSAALLDWTDAVIIMGIVLVSAALSFVQEYSAGAAVEKLQAQITLKVVVIRDGIRQSIPAEKAIPGDIVLLSAGSLVPSDGVILESRDLFVNQAVLTGETFPVEKTPGTARPEATLSERANVVFMGTNVRSGSGKMLVVETGARTTFGQIAGHLALRPPENEFEHGIRRLGFLLTEVMLILVIAIFALNVFFKKPVLDSLLFSIALAVGLTPQLLPAIIEINLSKGARALAKSGVIVRRLSSIENFGSMNVLCTDKTGTITQGVVKLDGALDAEGKVSDQVLQFAYLNAYFQTGLSNPLDVAITASAQPDISQYSKVDEIPYDFVRKRLTVAITEAGNHNSEAILVTKGALDAILLICSAVAKQGEIAPLDEAEKSRIHALYQKWSGEGYRVLGVAFKRVEHKPVYRREDEVGMIFAGFLLFFDPPKEGVKQVVAELEDLGVQLKIISGDNRLVAEHAVRSIGLAITGVLTSGEILNMNDEALWHAVQKVNVFAEVDPNQKERIILALKKMGQVVGYLGDGVNDAPALHSADVGISVDNAVDVAKEAADFVLMRHDLEVLKEGVVQGRLTFANTMKYIFMATSANFGNMFSVAGVSLFLPFLPMLPKQILLINLLTDIPEMTIANDRVDKDLIRKPRKWDIHFIRRFMLVFGSLSSLFDFSTFAVLLFVLKASPAMFRTGWFIESVFSAAMVVLSLRTRRSLTHSRPGRGLLVMSVCVSVLALLVPYTPLARVMGFEPLPPLFLGAVGLIVMFYILSAEITKRFFYVRH